VDGLVLLRYSEVEVKCFVFSAVILEESVEVKWLSLL